MIFWTLIYCKNWAFDITYSCFCLCSGRKANCIVYGVLYGLACVTKVSWNLHRFLLSVIYTCNRQTATDWCFWSYWPVGSWNKRANLTRRLHWKLNCRYKCVVKSDRNSFSFSVSKTTFYAVFGSFVYGRKWFFFSFSVKMGYIRP